MTWSQWVWRRLCSEGQPTRAYRSQWWVVYGVLEITELPDYNKITFKENPAIPLEEIVPDTSPQAVDLLNKFLVYPSKQRISARQALLHPYLFSEPLPAHHSELPIPQHGGKHSRQRLQPPVEFSVDLPLSESLVDPALVQGHAWCL
ncbi:unnamed protein product [Oncorhynchus mykiss]|uniref:Protein kinase domain-containing protein n=1 Tax=Oncorhynchus mykiss TaxID=8022 RepID=A0A060YR33_ONCMY|nr:unnamed protein product [Oncorhynchus mykiss]